MARNMVSRGALLPLLLLVGAIWFGSAPTLWAQSYPCYSHHPFVCGFDQGFYTTDGRNIYYFPYGFPRALHRHSIYYNSGPDFRWATRYRWSHQALCAFQRGSQLSFQGPYWTHAVYRPSRGLFRRSSWRCTWVPYYYAAIPNAPALGGTPPGTLPGPAMTPSYPAFSGR